MKAVDGDEIIFGFHRRDDFFYFKYQLEQLKDKFCELLKKKIVFDYPLEDNYKYEILDEVRKCGIERFCWTCEYPIAILHECGKCLPCKNKLVAEFESNINKDLNVNVDKVIFVDKTKEED